jgi:hypothetical protein
VVALRVAAVARVPGRAGVAVVRVVRRRGNGRHHTLDALEVVVAVVVVVMMAVTHRRPFVKEAVTVDRIDEWTLGANARLVLDFVGVKRLPLLAFNTFALT